MAELPILLAGAAVVLLASCFMRLVLDPGSVVRWRERWSAWISRTDSTQTATHR